MSTLQSFIGLLSQLIWPTVVIVIIFVFRDQLKDVFWRLSNFSIATEIFKIETAMAGHVSAEILEKLKKNPEILNLAGERRTVTILHSRTLGYSAVNETLPPKETAELLNIYLSKMTDVIFELDGTLDRYSGSEITAYWGAPIQYDDSAERACEAALKMLEAAKDLSPEFERLGFPQLFPVSAITTTEVMVGNFGSEQRFNYSIIGDYEYILNQLIHLNYNLQTNTLLAEYSHKLISEKYQTKLLDDEPRIKGMEQYIAAYELLGGAAREAD